MEMKSYLIVSMFILTTEVTSITIVPVFNLMDMDSVILKILINKP